MAAKRRGDTRERILAAAQRLIQARGFGGFSYADIASTVRIEKASIHHHFPTKGDLGKALMGRYRTLFRQGLEAIDSAERDPAARLRRYQDLFAGVLRDGNRMCMCGMMAADLSALPRAVGDEVRAFFDENEIWLARVLEEGQSAGSLRFGGSPQAQARVVLSAFEGAMLVARSHRDVDRFDVVAERVLANLQR